MICKTCKNDLPETRFSKFKIKHTLRNGMQKVYDYQRHSCNVCNNRRTVELAIRRAFRTKKQKV